MVNLEDSESLLRAFRRKKAELDQIREAFFQMETENISLKQELDSVNKRYEQVSTRVRTLEEDQRKGDISGQKTRQQLTALQQESQVKAREVDAYRAEI